MIERRLFLKDLGKLGIAMVVVSACGPGAAGDPAPTTSRSGAGGPTTTPLVPGSSSTSPSSTTLAVGIGVGASTVWERVNLGSVSAYILARGGEAAVIDTGAAGNAPAIAMSLGQIGLGWADVSHVVATHLHPDHIGSWAAVMDGAAGASGYAGQADLPSIASPRPLIGLSDGDSVFDVRVIATPGHTPGHISLLDEPAGILVAGDSLNGTDGSGLTGANPQYTPDMETANDSIAKMAGFDFSVVLVGHGEPVVKNGAATVRALVTG